MRRLWILGATLLCLLAPAAARAAYLQPIGNFEKPIYVTSDPGNPDRLFVVERPGRIKVVEGGSVATFADLTSPLHHGGGRAGATLDRDGAELRFHGALLRRLRPG